MNEISFEWDKRKASANKTKHGISFEEASSVFLDQNGWIYCDPEHSDFEERLLIHGISRSLRVLVVCYCYREKTETIRIISARKANRQETQYYFRRI